ncbi:phosphotransferase [bacterium]|nr:phosphotransferase [bacterium]
MDTAENASKPLIKEGLSTLDSAMDEGVMRDALLPIVKDRLGDDRHIRELNCDVLRSRSKRCVLRYRLRLSDSRNSRSVEWNLIGKVFRPHFGEKIFNNMRNLWKNGFSGDAVDGISMPEPIAFLSQLNLLVLQEIPGLPIKTVLKERPQAEPARQLARALAKLQSCQVELEKTFSIREHLMRCHPKHGVLSFACPELEPLIDFIVERAYAIGADFVDSDRYLLHGDLHLGQMHVLNGKAWLIDFDSMSHGDPAADLGNVLVFMKSKAQKDSTMHKLIDVFLEEYFEYMDPGIAARIPLYESLTHLRRACKSLRLQREGWRQRAKRMVEEGASILRNGELS